MVPQGIWPLLELTSSSTQNLGSPSRTWFSDGSWKCLAGLGLIGRYVIWGRNRSAFNNMTDQFSMCSIFNNIHGDLCEQFFPSQKHIRNRMGSIKAESQFQKFSEHDCSTSRRRLSNTKCKWTQNITEHSYAFALTGFMVRHPSRGHRDCVAAPWDSLAFQLPMWPLVRKKFLDEPTFLSP